MGASRGVLGFRSADRWHLERIKEASTALPTRVRERAEFRINSARCRAQFEDLREALGRIVEASARRLASVLKFFWGSEALPDGILNASGEQARPFQTPRGSVPSSE